VFKQVLKLIKQKLCVTSNIRLHSDNGDHFYSQFFNQKLIKRGDTSLETFYDPLNSRLKDPTFNTLTNEYFKHIFQSAPFKAVFVQNINPDTFFSYYHKGMGKNLDTLRSMGEDHGQRVG